jgi:putative cell wall-binding protein
MWSIVKKAGVITLALLLCASVPAIAAAKTTAKNHTMAGTVKSIDANTLVLSRSGKKADVTFALDSSTKKNGTLEVGTPVSVTYHESGTSRSAVSVTAKSTTPTHKK